MPRAGQYPFGHRAGQDGTSAASSSGGSGWSAARFAAAQALIPTLDDFTNFRRNLTSFANFPAQIAQLSNGNLGFSDSAGPTAAFWGMGSIIGPGGTPATRGPEAVISPSLLLGKYVASFRAASRGAFSYVSRLGVFSDNALGYGVFASINHASGIVTFRQQNAGGTDIQSTGVTLALNVMHTFDIVSDGATFPKLYIDGALVSTGLAGRIDGTPGYVGIYCLGDASGVYPLELSDAVWSYTHG